MAIATLSHHGESFSYESDVFNHHSPYFPGPDRHSPPTLAAHIVCSDRQELVEGRKAEADLGLDDASPVHESDSCSFDSECNEFETFARTRSRVLKLCKPWLGATDAFGAQCVKKVFEPTLWKRGDSQPPSRSFDPWWVVFKTHEEACTALCTSVRTLIFTPATERELEATNNLHQVAWSELETMSNAVSAESIGRSAASYWQQYSNDLHSDARPGPTGSNGNPQEHYSISSNPPNPKLSFRAGDWWCPIAHCAAHNFGRNVGCIKCGTPRAGNGALPGSGPEHLRMSPPPQISPRFINQLNAWDEAGHMLETRISPPLALHTHLANRPNHGSSSPQSINIGSKPPVPQYPILTPSGAALSAGGRVRNVSTDPLNPCIMYWPDNEPGPEQGQIRPFGSAVLQFPPIINTGNKGAAEKQPGDWVCQKCKYLNWRRRKVCQTCFPYAEGNGDSISTAVQAERIALLAGVLNKADPFPQRQLPLPPNGYARDHIQFYPGQESTLRVVPRQEVPTNLQSIYQTPESSGHYSPPARMEHPSHSYTQQRNFLPAFLQDIVHPPALSPAGSASSSDTGLEDSFAAFDVSEGHAAPRMRAQPYSANSSTSVSSASIASIWKLEGEERKNFGLGNVSPVEKAFTPFA